ncbi:MAG: hypothetical protein ACAH20_12295 [Methylobacteriaceae bacterium]
MIELNDTPLSEHSTPPALGVLKRAAAATDAWAYCSDLRQSIDEMLLLLRPGRSFQFSENERMQAHRLVALAFEVGRSVQPPHCSPDAMGPGLRSLAGLFDILTLSEDQRGYSRQVECERVFVRRAKRLRKLLGAAQHAILDEASDTDVEMPPLLDQKHLAGPPAALIPFRLETQASIERGKAHRAHEAATLWQRAEDRFLAAQNLDDPATPYADGLRLLSEGLAAGFCLPEAQRAKIGIAMLGARGTIARVFVPSVLPEAHFETLRTRAHHILDALTTDAVDRAQAEPEWIDGICAEASFHANVFANAALARTYLRAEESVRRHFAQQAG